MQRCTVKSGIECCAGVVYEGVVGVGVGIQVQDSGSAHGKLSSC